MEDRSDMPNRSDELTRLMQRYRALCEATGIARANGIPLAAAAQNALVDLEQRILGFAELGASTSPHAPITQTPPLSNLDLSPVSPPPPAPKPQLSGAPRIIPAPTVQPLAVPPAPPAQMTVSEGRRSLVSRLVRPAEPLSEMANAVDPSCTEAASNAKGLPAVVFTDGSAEGNPGPGGYCALVRIPGRPDRELSGGTAHTTNNKMELTAAIVGLRTAIEAGATEVTVYSDSEYLVKGMTDWLPGWKRKNWQTAGGQPVKNRELWEQLAQLVDGRTVRWNWVKGHAGHPENEHCDLVATAAARRVAKSHSTSNFDQEL